MEQISITYKKSMINFSIFGTGDKLLICLHGYGESGSSFAPLEEKLGKEYTLVAMDFPFHGGTMWNEGLLITPDDLSNILALIRQQIETNGNRQHKFYVLAFSLGGRIALHMLQSASAQIERMVLIAPDGLHQNFWYWLATQTLLGNKLFAYSMKNPYWLFLLASLGNKTQLLNKSILKVIHYYLDEEDGRLLLYRRWTTMRKFKPRQEAILDAINNYHIQLRFLFGSYDKIILSNRSKFLKGNPYAKITIISAGHQLLKEKYADDIALLFSQ